MFHEAILSEALQLQLSRIGHDRLSVLGIDINVLSLDLSRSLATEMSRWVSHCEVRQDHVSVNHVAVANMDALSGLERALSQVALCLLSCLHCLV